MTVFTNWENAQLTGGGEAPDGDPTVGKITMDNSQSRSTDAQTDKWPLERVRSGSRRPPTPVDAVGSRVVSAPSESCLSFAWATLDSALR